MKPKNPHNHLTRQGKPPLDMWKCEYCHITGPLDEVTLTECTYEYPPCPHCGQTPECAVDCPGMMEVLNAPGVYLAGVINDDGVVH